MYGGNKKGKNEDLDQDQNIGVGEDVTGEEFGEAEDLGNDTNIGNGDDSTSTDENK